MVRREWACLADKAASHAAFAQACADACQQVWLAHGEPEDTRNKKMVMPGEPGHELEAIGRAAPRSRECAQQVAELAVIAASSEGGIGRPGWFDPPRHLTPEAAESWAWHVAANARMDLEIALDAQGRLRGRNPFDFSTHPEITRIVTDHYWV